MNLYLPFSRLINTFCRFLFLLLALCPVISVSGEENYGNKCPLHTSVLAAEDIGAWTVEAVTNAPVARHENGFVEVNGKFYLLGGRGNKPVNIYDPATKTWSQGKTLPKTTSGTDVYLHHFQAVSLKGLIYVAGAFQGSYPNETPVAHVYIYNPATDTWQIGKEIPANRRRGAAGVVVYNDKLYIVGGITNGHSSGFVKWLDEFDPATNTWTPLSDANFARDHFHAAVVGNRLYAAGGRRSSASTGQVFSLTVPEVDVYDFTTKAWLAYPNGIANIPTQRAGTTVAVLGNEVIVVGGESASNTNNLAHNQAEALNTLTGTWRTLDPLNTGRHGTQALVFKGGIYIAAGSANQGGGPELTSLESFFFQEPVYTNWTERALALGKRAEGQSIVYKDKIYVFGGFAPGIKIQHTNEVYNPQNNQWTVLKTMPLDPQGKPYTVTHNGIAVVDESIWIVGGRIGDNPGPVTDKVWIYSITNDSWSAGPTLPAPRAGGGLARLGRKLYLFGGFGPTACNNDKGDHFLYDLDKPQLGWQNTLAPLPNPRNHFGTATAGGKIYAIGGQYGHDCGGGQDVNLVHMYDPFTNTWTKVKDFPNNNSHIEPGTFALDGKIIVVGGEINGNAVWQYDPLTNAWTTLDQLPVNLIAPSGKVINNNLIVSHGGLPSTDNSQNITRVKTINRIRSNKLGFLPAGLTISAKATDAPVSKEALLWTLTGSTTYTLNTGNLPSWLTVTPLKNTTDESGIQVKLEFNPAGLPGGTYTYSLMANAANYTTATLALSFSVSGTIANQAPVVTNPGNQTSTEGSAVSLQINATDENTLTYQAKNLPLGLSMNTSGLISGTIAANAATNSPYQTQITVTDNGSPSLSTQITFTWTVTSPSTPVALVRINAGGAATTVNGVSWTGCNGTAACNNYVSGGFAYTQNPPPAITGVVAPLNQAILQTEWTGGQTNGVPVGQIAFTYNIPVANGTYMVRLHFVELNKNGAGLRVFDVNLEGGTKELSGFDIFAQAGGIHKAIYRDFPVSITDGNVTVDFIRQVENAKVSAIEIFAQTSANRPPILSPVANQALAEGQQVSIALQATDPDEDNLVYSFTNLPAFGTFTNGVLTFSPNFTQSGTYQIKAKVTDTGGLSDEKTFGLTVTDVPQNVQSVSSFTLVNANTDTDIHTIANGAVINLAQLPTQNLNIRANTNPAMVGSVVFVLNGASVTENVAPYAVKGDNNGNYNAWVPAVGNYTLSATPYSSSKGSGTKGNALTISFSVINQAAAPAARVSQADKEATETQTSHQVHVFPNPASDKLTISAMFGQKTTVHISITSLRGEVVLSEHMPVQTFIEKELNLTSLKAGLYFVKVDYDGNSKVFKVLKK